MKPSYIIAILAIIVSVVLLFSASQDASSYNSFEDAALEDRKIKVIGTLVQDQEMIYNPEENPNLFSFYVEDQEGMIKKVIYNDAKPQDFEMSEQIVMTGKMSGDTFLASELLLKCPSKYKDEEIVLKENVES